MSEVREATEYRETYGVGPTLRIKKIVANRLTLPACVKSAAPTCTLWERDELRRMFEFRPWPDIAIGDDDVLKARR